MKYKNFGRSKVKKDIDFVCIFLTEYKISSVILVALLKQEFLIAEIFTKPLFLLLGLIIVESGHKHGKKDICNVFCSQ